MRQGVKAKSGGASQEQAAAEALRVARQLFEQSPDWVIFLREILGLRGVVRQLFPSQEDLAAFERSPEHAEIQHMLAVLRSRVNGQSPARERTRVITVRIPESLHSMLTHEARERSTSVNKLCITKLLQMIDEENSPSD